MASRKVTIAVDEKFFKNVFEKQRKTLQLKLGVINLSQTNFTKMIKGFEMIKERKPNASLKKRRKRNDFFKI